MSLRMYYTYHFTIYHRLTLSFSLFLFLPFIVGLMAYPCIINFVINQFNCNWNIPFSICPLDVCLSVTWSHCKPLDSLTPLNCYCNYLCAVWHQLYHITTATTAAKQIIQSNWLNCVLVLYFCHSTTLLLCARLINEFTSYTHCHWCLTYLIFYPLFGQFFHQKLANVSGL